MSGLVTRVPEAHDVVVLDAGGGVRLAQDLHDHVGRLRELHVEHLHGHVGGARPMAYVDRAERAVAETPQQAPAAERRPQQGERAPALRAERRLRRRADQRLVAAGAAEGLPFVAVAELGVADAQVVARLEHRLHDAGAVHEGPVLAAHVLDVKPLRRGRDLGVAARATRVRHFHPGRAGIAAEHQLARRGELDPRGLRQAVQRNKSERAQPPPRLPRDRTGAHGMSRFPPERAG